MVDESSDNSTSTGINALKIEGGRIVKNQRSVSSEQQAYQIAQSVQKANEHRARRAAAAQEAYDGAPPIKDKVSTAQSWQANFSTRWLAGRVDTLEAQLRKSVMNQPVITASTLPDSRTDAKFKTDTFRSTTTDCIRKWPEWSEFVESVARETVLQGYTFAAWLDGEVLFPKLFRTTEAFVPDKSKQDPGSIQYFAIKQDYLLHEFVEMIQDVEAAADAGYKVENCLQAAAKASNLKESTGDSGSDVMEFVNWINQGALGCTYSNTTPISIPVWVLYNQETTTGKVSLWVVHRENGKLLRYTPDILDKMSDLMTVFTFEVGNGTIHSSQGLGRKVGPLAMAIERTRNLSADSSYMRQLVTLVGAATAKNKPVVKDQFLVIPPDLTMQKMELGGTMQDFVTLDGQLQMWAQQSAGTYITSLDQNLNSDKTATQASIDAQREQEQADSTRARFLDQFADVISTCQRRIYRDDLIDAAQGYIDRVAGGEDLDKVEADMKKEDYFCAVWACYRLLNQGLTKTDIQWLRDDSASGFDHVEEGYIARGIKSVVTKYTGNPNIDQVALLRRDVEQDVGPEVADELVIKDVDETVEAEAQRQQAIESASMYATGIPLPVSRRDNHMVHAAVLVELLNQVAPAMRQVESDPKMLKTVELNLNHMAEHLNYAMQMGNKSPELKEMEKFLQQYASDFKASVQIKAEANAKAEAIAEATQQATPTSQPVVAPVEAGTPVPPAVPPAPAPTAG